MNFDDALNAAVTFGVLEHLCHDDDAVAAINRRYGIDPHLYFSHAWLRAVIGKLVEEAKTHHG